MKQKDSFHPNIGASSILMIFVVLCLTTFGVLSLVTANADKKISTKNAETVQSYYKAGGQVESRLQELDASLATARTDAQNAVKDPMFLTLMSDSVYSENGQEYKKVESLLKGGDPQSKKLAEVYGYFARCRAARNTDVSVSGSGETGSASFQVKIDDNRYIQVTLSILPYGSAQRYGNLKEQMMVRDESQDDGSLQLWQGDSSAAD